MRYKQAMKLHQGDEVVVKHTGVVHRVVEIEVQRENVHNNNRYSVMRVVRIVTDTGVSLYHTEVK